MDGINNNGFVPCDYGTEGFMQGGCTEGGSDLPGPGDLIFNPLPEEPGGCIIEPEWLPYPGTEGGVETLPWLGGSEGGVETLPELLPQAPEFGEIVTNVFGNADAPIIMNPAPEGGQSPEDLLNALQQEAQAHQLSQLISTMKALSGK
jgi:hypothetical protein